MSAEASAWALRQRAGSPATKCVLLVLADVSDQQGHSWYSQRDIAKMAECSVRTVRTHLHRLEELGLLYRIEWRRSDGSRSTDLYALRVPGAPPPEEVAGGRVATRRGVLSTVAGAPGSLFPGIEPKEEPPPIQNGDGPRQETPPDPEGDYTEEFEAVWSIHARGGKRPAFRAFLKAVPSKVGLHRLIEALTAYSRRVDARVGFDGAHLSTWINQEMWHHRPAEAKGAGRVEWD